ncbi:MAG: hypothetical protein AB7S74_11655 [Hyphomicrobium sp.]
MSKVLVAVEGEEQAGAAARYLIDRARNSVGGFFMIAGVQPARTGTGCDLVRQICDTAGPWLDDAGIRYEICSRVGDFGDVVSALSRDETYNEIVIIAQAEDSFKATLQRLLGLKPRNPVRRIAARDGTPVTLVRAPPSPNIFSL